MQNPTKMKTIGKQHTQCNKEKGDNIKLTMLTMNHLKNLQLPVLFKFADPHMYKQRLPRKKRSATITRFVVYRIDLEPGRVGILGITFFSSAHETTMEKISRARGFMEDKILAMTQHIESPHHTEKKQWRRHSGDNGEDIDALKEECGEGTR